jgi:ABC-type bacteriocin/lantibiotic exporter with double-glycine peptidase domain
MKQEVAYFEQNNVESMPSDIGQYFTQVSKGIGESYAGLIVSVGTFLGGIGISFYRSPVFALICIAYIPLIVITMSIFGQLSKAESFKKLEANKELGGFSEESLSALKLIVSFA